MASDSLWSSVVEFLKHRKPNQETIKLFSCSTQLRVKFILLINVNMPTAIVGTLTFTCGFTGKFVGFGYLNVKFQYLRAAFISCSI